MAQAEQAGKAEGGAFIVGRDPAFAQSSEVAVHCTNPAPLGGIPRESPRTKLSSLVLQDFFDIFFAKILTSSFVMHKHCFFPPKSALGSIHIYSFEGHHPFLQCVSKFCKKIEA